MYNGAIKPVVYHGYWRNMGVEVELKVRLDDFEMVKKQLTALGKYNRSYHKSDSYWFSPQLINSNVRIRHENGLEADGAVHQSIMVTYKIKEISQGIEVNDEREFSVSDVDVFEELLRRIGMHQEIRKEKNGWAWNIASETTEQPSILAELSLVTGLGWFLELEILCTEEEIIASRSRLLALLAILEIPEDRIEGRPYTQLLKDLEI